MNQAMKLELTDKRIARFLCELNELMQKHHLLLNRNAGVNVRTISGDFKGYMAEKWSNGKGYDLRGINKRLIYPE